MTKTDKVKAGVAGGIFAIALIVFLYFNVFSGPSASPPEAAPPAEAKPSTRTPNG